MSATDARLIRPSIAYREGYTDAIREHQREGRYLDSRYIDANVSRLERDFDGFVRDLLERERPVRPTGRVPEIFYWLVDGDEYIGQASFRDFAPGDPALREVGHIGYDVRPSRQGRGYGRAILGTMLAEMRRRGVGHVYVNCDEDNERSRRVIERWHGLFEESIAIPGRSFRRRRYRIDLEGPE